MIVCALVAPDPVGWALMYRVCTRYRLAFSQENVTLVPGSAW